MEILEIRTGERYTNVHDWLLDLSSYWLLQFVF